MSPTSNGHSTYYSNYTRGLTHGVPSGGLQDDKKNTKLGIAGGDFVQVFKHGYHRDSVNEMQAKDEQY